MFEKAEMCLGLWPLKSQPISRMAFTACSLTSLPGLMPALQTCMPRLADIFNMASAIGLRLAFLMQTKSIFKISGSVEKLTHGEGIEIGVATVCKCCRPGPAGELVCVESLGNDPELWPRVCV